MIGKNLHVPSDGACAPARDPSSGSDRAVMREPRNDREVARMLAHHAGPDKSIPQDLDHRGFLSQASSIT